MDWFSFSIGALCGFMLVAFPLQTLHARQQAKLRGCIHALVDALDRERGANA